MDESITFYLFSLAHHVEIFLGMASLWYLASLRDIPFLKVRRASIGTSAKSLCHSECGPAARVSCRINFVADPKHLADNDAAAFLPPDASDCVLMLAREVLGLNGITPPFPLLDDEDFFVVPGWQL